ncbi:MAG: hypothetical protein ACK559_15750, partial [bacterium]
PGHYLKDNETSLDQIINQNNSSFFRSIIPRLEIKKNGNPGPGEYYSGDKMDKMCKSYNSARKSSAK